MSFQIRSSESQNLADAEGISRVQVLGWKAAYPGMVPQSRLDEMNFEERAEAWRSIYRADASGDLPVVSAKLVAIAEDEVIGFACFGTDRDRRDDAERGELWSLYVLPEMWGTGVGHALLRASEAGLSKQGRQRASLWVLEANARGRTFYERQGWEFDGTVQGQQIHGVDVPQVRYEVDLSR